MEENYNDEKDDDDDDAEDAEAGANNKEHLCFTT
jgi:hypothetical protein